MSHSAVSDVPEGGQEGLLPRLPPLVPPGAQGDLLQGAHPQLQAGAHQEVQPSAQNQVRLRKIVGTHCLGEESIHHIYHFSYQSVFMFEWWKITQILTSLKKSKLLCL